MSVKDHNQLHGFVPSLTKWTEMGKLRSQLCVLGDANVSGQGGTFICVMAN